MIYFLLKKLLSLQLKIICFNKTCTKGSNGDHEYIEILSFLLKELTLYDMFLVKKWLSFQLKIICFNKTCTKGNNGDHEYIEILSFHLK